MNKSLLMPAIVSGGSVSRLNIRRNLVGSDGAAKEPQKSLKARGSKRVDLI